MIILITTNKTLLLLEKLAEKYVLKEKEKKRVESTAERQALARSHDRRSGKMTSISTAKTDSLTSNDTDSHVWLQARLMSQALRKLTGGLNQTGTTMIFINQLREKIGVFFGSPETTSGGKALKFYASVRLDIRRIETLKEGTDAVGNRTRVKVVKNKMAPPFKQAEFDIIYGTGISREGSLIDFGVEHDIVKKSGAWYTYEGDQLGQGKENARKYLIEHADLANDIERKILSALGVGKVTAVPPLEAEGSPAQGNPAEDAAAEATPVESLEDKIAERKAAGA